jgi:menaquinone-dependent protoporphyrinogen oxidase
MSRKPTSSADVLVTYASRGGSTAEIADVIHQVLVANGLTVDLRPMQTVDDITPYQAVVAGSAIHRQKWLPEAMNFMRRHQAELRQKPFAAFLVCMVLSMPTARAQQSAEAWLQPVRALLNPVSEGYFAGALDLRKVPFGYRLLFRVAITLGVWSEGDYRDWEAIRHWADGLPAKLLQPSVDRQHR